MKTVKARSLLAVAAATAWLACMPGQAAGPGAADQLRSLVADSYEALLRQVGSTIKRGTKEFDVSLERSVGAILAARPEGCGDDRLLADLCGIQPILVTSSAMAPSLFERDAVLAVPVSAKRPLEHGDIVVFRQPKEGNAKPSQQISRVIALPGERVEIKGGTARVNGARLAQAPTGVTILDTFSGRDVPVLRETTPEAKSYLVASPPPPAPVPELDERAVATVPGQSYFVLGDNRHNAVDSRLPALLGGNGFVRRDAVIGRVVSVYASADAERIGRGID